MGQNIIFKDKRDLILIEPKVDDIVKKTDTYYKKPQKINEIAYNGYVTAQQVYSFDKHVLSRIEVIKEELEKM